MRPKFLIKLFSQLWCKLTATASEYTHSDNDSLRLVKHQGTMVRHLEKFNLKVSHLQTTETPR